MNAPSLGHHRIGDCLWYTAFENADPLDLFELDGTLKKGRQFKTHEEFLALVTFLHESSHFIQDHTLGICAWVQMNADQFAIAVHALAGLVGPSASLRAGEEGPHKGSNQFAIWADHLPKEKQFIEDIIYSSKILDGILDVEIRAHPLISDSLIRAYGLTGQDLLECHAAILTERRIGVLLAKYGDAFNRTVLEDMASYFRPEKMPACHKVLELFQDYLGFIKFDRANKQHPLFPHCSRAAEYGLLLFVLDFALHTCPLPQIGVAANGSALQDVVPGVRFLKLLGSVVPSIMAMEDPTRFTLDERYLHTDFMRCLVAHINCCNEEVAKSGSAKEDTFLPSDKISTRWMELFKELATLAEMTGVRDLFDLFHRTRIKDMESLVKDPLHVYRANVIGMALKLGIYPMFSTKTRVGLATPFFLTEQTTDDGRTVYNIPASPHSLMDTHIARLMFIALSECLYLGKTFCCPLARQYTFYPCPRRSNNCESISHSSGMPECFAKQVWSDFYRERTF